MKVKSCKGCPYLRRYVWTEYYEPKNYHAVGFSHAYAFCEKYGKRVLSIKMCNGNPKTDGKEEKQ